MEDIELKGNSFKQKAIEAVEEEPKTPIVKGNVKQKKKSSGRQFVENFVNEDGETIKSHVLFDIIVPALKDMISSGFQAALDMLLYGNVQDHRSSAGVRRAGGQTNYNAISNQKNNQNKKYATTRAAACDDILFDERADAMQVLDELRDQIETYGYSAVYDLYDAAGLSCDYTWKNWGWYDLSSATVVRTRDGDFMISLPKPIVIK